MTSIPPVFNFDQWIADHADQLKPPVNNKQMWELQAISSCKSWAA